MPSMEKNGVDMNRLRWHLELYEISQVYVGEILGMTQPNVSAILGGNRPIKAGDLFKILVTFNIPLSAVILEEYKDIIR